jgi:hypothetical protein
MAINVPIVSQFVPTGVEKAVKEFQNLETTGQKVGMALEKAFLPAVAAVGALAAGAVLSAKAAAEDAREQAQLARQINASTTATEAQIAATNEYIMQQELLSAISATELRPALAILVRHTGDLAKAQQLLSLAMNVSVGTGRDVFDVAERMAEGFTGVLTPLEELDYGLVQSIENGASFDDIMGSLAATFGGAVAKDAETAAGRFARMQVQMQQVQETIGYALLPIIEKLLPTLESLAVFIGDNTDLIIGIGVAVGTFATAIIAANLAMKAWTVLSGITAAVNAVLATSFSVLWVATGVGIIIAIIAAVVALQLKFDIFGKAIDGLTRLFNTLWSVAKYTLGAIIDGINVLIRAWNKLPLVDDIPEISADFLEMKEATDEVATGIDNVTAVAINAEYEMAELRRQTGLSADMMTSALLPALDSTRVALNTAAWELAGFYNQLDREDAFARFSDSLARVQEELQGLEPGSDEFETTMRDALRAVQQLSDTLGYIPAELEKTLLYRVQIGDIEGAERLGALISASDTYRATANDELRFLGGASSSPSGVVNNVTINVQGADPNATVSALEEYVRQSGAVPIVTTANRRV